MLSEFCFVFLPCFLYGCAKVPPPDTKKLAMGKVFPNCEFLECELISVHVKIEGEVAVGYIRHLDIRPYMKLVQVECQCLMIVVSIYM